MFLQSEGTVWHQCKPMITYEPSILRIFCHVHTETPRPPTWSSGSNELPNKREAAAASKGRASALGSALWRHQIQCTAVSCTALIIYIYIYIYTCFWSIYTILSTWHEDQHLWHMIFTIIFIIEENLQSIRPSDNETFHRWIYLLLSTYCTNLQSSNRCANHQCIKVSTHVPINLYTWIDLGATGRESET